jgi:voltage-gated potassium channel
MPASKAVHCATSLFTSGCDLMIGSHARPRIRESRFWRRYDQRRYAILFYALLLTLLIIPVATAFGLPMLLTKVLLTACLFAAVMPNSTKRTRQILFTATLLLVLANVTSELRYLSVNPALVLALVGLTGLAAAAGALRFTITAKSVNSETIYAALSTYLLAGIFFGQIYWSIEGVRPGSLVSADALTEQSAIYFSFVTLATLGYGDILPRTDVARGIAIFEVIGGQLFLAVMVARLIGAFEPKKPI